MGMRQMSIAITRGVPTFCQIGTPLPSNNMVFSRNPLTITKYFDQDQTQQIPPWIILVSKHMLGFANHKMITAHARQQI